MKIITLTGQIKIITGLHIGGGDDTMKIGGIDNNVIKTANGNKPYIPGSSLKGKMRSLLEWHYGLVKIQDNGKPFSHNKLDKVDNNQKQDTENLIRLFGSGESGNHEFGITRISVSDCKLSQDSLDRHKQDQLKLTEAKFENTINRKTGTARDPRQTERVPAGVSFDFNIHIKVLDGDSKDQFKAMLEEGLNLIEQDYLGGSGSRGYGRVQFENRKWSDEDKNKDINNDTI